jgi:hypothetical protein
MNNFYLKIPSLDTKFYTDYFLNEYIPKYDILGKLTTDKELYYRDFMLEEKYYAIEFLENTLKEEFKIPFKVDCVMLFYHTLFQHRIHIDKKNNTYRYASLNLPLIGFENTKMIFYQLKNLNDTYNNVTDAFYFNNNDVTPVSELDGKNEWVLVNSGIPHNIITTVNNPLPRITLCIRFKSNPKFEILANFLQNRIVKSQPPHT